MKIFNLLGIFCSLSILCGCDKKQDSASSFAGNCLSQYSVQFPSYSKEILTYTYQYESDCQTIQVNWLNKDTIEFKLTADWLPCLYSQEGIAVLKAQALEKISKLGKKHNYQEYVIQDETQLKSIFISFPRSAWIQFDYEDEMDECDPDSDAIMLLNARSSL
jgi:hypothetical protein